MKLTKRAQFLVDNLDLPAASGVQSAQWEHFQIAHLCDDGLFRIENKSRQISWSFNCSAEATADALLEEQSSLFTSINIDEAKEKIRYVRDVLGNVKLRGLPKITTDNQLEIGFDNGARIISMPSKPPRGKPRYNVYLDEFAHVEHDREIYVGANAVISKGGRVRIGSSPFGTGGVFWDVFSQSINPYPKYSRKTTPWWHCHGLCVNVAEAVKVAPALPTAERVSRFANERIQTIFSNYLLEDFQQEYECSFNDQSTAWIGFDEIRAVQEAELICFKASVVGRAIGAALQAIDDLAAAKLEAVYSAGVDVGRTRNTTELFIVGLSSVGSFPLRLMVTLDNCDFDEQFEVMVYALTKLSIAKLLIDKNGLGMNLAENLAKRFPFKAEGAHFDNASKTLWATDAKMLISQHKTPLPIDRDLAYQINSIKRTITPSKNMAFDTDRNEKHHADKFWAWCLALAAGKVPKVRPIISSRVYNPTDLF